MISKSSNLTSNESFENFLFDTLVRQFDSHNWITEELETLNLSDSLGLFNLTKKQRKYFYCMYKSMIKKLSKDFTISSGNNFLKPDEIYYHKRFGWTLASSLNSNIANEMKVFLGKTSILERTKIVMGKRTYISGHSLIRGGWKIYCWKFFIIS